MFLSKLTSIGLFVILGLSFVVPIAEAETLGEETLDVGSGKQLFLGPWSKDGRDEYLVESMKNVTMTMNEAKVTGERLLVLNKPWEMDPTRPNQLDPYMSVIQDGDMFRMYYGAFTRYEDRRSEPNCRILCYAESKDGIHWVKPNLGLCTWEGSKDNNILFPNDNFKYVVAEYAGPWAFIDPHAKSPDEKYKLIIRLSQIGARVVEPRLMKGQYLFSSGDGIHWIRPDLGIYEVAGTRNNNVILSDAAPVTHNFSPFLDTREGIDPAHRYKALGGTKKSGLIAYVSGDGMHWNILQEEPVFAEPGLLP